MLGRDCVYGMGGEEVGGAPPIHCFRVGLRADNSPPTGAIPRGKCLEVKETPNFGQRASERTKQ